MPTHSVDKVIVDVMTRKTSGGSFKTKDKIFFFKELSYLLKGGVSIIDSIKTMAETASTPAVKEICQYIYYMLDEGKSLTYALSRMPKAFPDGDVAIIKSGEQSGRMTTVLASLSKEYSFLGQIKSMYVGAMIYPVILITVSFIAVLALFIFILPGIFQLVDQFDAGSIPKMTQILMAFSTFLRTYPRQIIGTMSGVGIALGLYLSTDSGKRSFYDAIFSIPMISKMTKYYYLIKFARYMRLMLEAGLSYIDIFKLEKEIISMPAYQDMIDDVIHGLDRGKGIFDEMQYHENLIPADVLVLLKVGEETATLKDSLHNIGEMYEEDLRHMINNIGKVIEPVLIVGVGGIIAMVALSVFGLIGNILDALPAI